MPSPPCAPKINPALTTFGKTSTASARDDTLAAAEFCDLSWLRAARDSLVKLANAVPDVSNTASVNAARYLNVDLMVMMGLFGGYFLCLLLGISSSYRPRFWSGGRVEEGNIQAYAPVRTVTRTVSIIFAPDLDADRLLANLENLADLEN